MDQDALTEAFQALRPRLFGIAYRMLETRADAEDALQETWFRFQRARGVASVEAFLITTLTRACVDELEAARGKRSKYVGPWLPEPMVTTDEGAELEAGRHEALSMPMLQALGRLDPLERAVFVLHEVFGYPHDDIARFVGKRQDHCRQMAERAATRVRSERPRVEADATAHERLLTSILGAATKGDLARLEGLLTEDVTLYCDGGGRGMAATTPVVGPDPVARFMVAIAAQATEESTTDAVVLNGLPGAVVRVAGAVTTTVSLDVREGRVCRVYVVRNPQKLRGV